MKKLIFGLTTLLAACLPGGSDKEIEWSKLGTADFDSAVWARAGQEERGAMVASFLSSNDIFSLSRDDIRAQLGEPTGYYDYDTNLAYVIGPKGTVESVYADGYMIVFSFKAERVSTVKAVPDL